MKLITLLEAPKRPQLEATVRLRLKHLKAKLWQQELTTQQAINILNLEFCNLLIGFNETSSIPNSQSQAHRLSLDGAEMSQTGWITVHICDDLDELLNDDANISYEEFADTLNATIAHELVHREQFLKTVKTIEDIPNPNHMKSYLADHREVEAYAVQTALELLASFSIAEAKRLLSTRLHEAELYSDALRAYSINFEPETNTWKLFIKKVYQVLVSPVEE